MTQSAAAPLPTPKERRRLREAKSLSQAQLAAQLGVTRDTLRAWESGRTSPGGLKRESYTRLLMAPVPVSTPAPTAPVKRPKGQIQKREKARRPKRTPKPEPAQNSEPLLTETQEPERPQEAERSPKTERSQKAERSPKPARAQKPSRFRKSAARSTKAEPATSLKQAATAEPAASPKAASPKEPVATAERDASPEQTTIAEPATSPKELVATGERGATPERQGRELSGEQPLTRAPEIAFDALYTHAAPLLVRHAYLLCGRRALARESVERAFQLAWQRWPEVAVDPDPAGWVRAAAYEYAMSPWHRMRPGLRHPDAPPAEAADRELLGVLQSLPPTYRRTLLLYDWVGLDLPETAAETEASTPAAAHRILHAREAVAERLPELAVPEQLHRRLTALAAAEKLDAPKAALVRAVGERRTRFWTRAAIVVTTLIVGAAALTVRAAPTHYVPVPAPGAPVSGVPALNGPERLTVPDRALRDALRSELSGGPARLSPSAE